MAAHSSQAWRRAGVRGLGSAPWLAVAARRAFPAPVTAVDVAVAASPGAAPAATCDPRRHADASRRRAAPIRTAARACEARPRAIAATSARRAVRRGSSAIGAPRGGRGRPRPRASRQRSCEAAPFTPWILARNARAAAEWRRAGRRTCMRQSASSHLAPPREGGGRVAARYGHVTGGWRPAGCAFTGEGLGALCAPRDPGTPLALLRRHDSHRTPRDPMPRAPSRPVQESRAAHLRRPAPPRSRARDRAGRRSGSRRDVRSRHARGSRIPRRGGCRPPRSTRARGTRRSGPRDLAPCAASGRADRPRVHAPRSRADDRGDRVRDAACGPRAGGSPWPEQPLHRGRTTGRAARARRASGRGRRRYRPRSVCLGGRAARVALAAGRA